MPKQITWLVLAILSLVLLIGLIDMAWEHSTRKDLPEEPDPKRVDRVVREPKTWVVIKNDSREPLVNVSVRWMKDQVIIGEDRAASLGPQETKAFSLASLVTAEVSYTFQGRRVTSVLLSDLPGYPHHMVTVQPDGGCLAERR